LIFPNFYDIKVIADQSLGMFRSSLASLCERLGVQREDDCEHQAGSDSKITAKCFFELKKLGDGSVEQCKGDIFGLTPSDIGNMLMQKREQKSTFNIKKQGLANHNQFLINNE
jgi:DNA polymerase III epsilon subunit-like protein